VANWGFNASKAYPDPDWRMIATMARRTWYRLESEADRVLKMVLRIEMARVGPNWGEVVIGLAR
jgi:hypothetical protein